MITGMTATATHARVPTIPPNQYAPYPCAACRMGARAGAAARLPFAGECAVRLVLRLRRAECKLVLGSQRPLMPRWQWRVLHTSRR
jgi:hypothetical protein